MQKIVLLIEKTDIVVKQWQWRNKYGWRQCRKWLKCGNRNGNQWPVWRIVAMLSSQRLAAIGEISISSNLFEERKMAGQLICGEAMFTKCNQKLNEK